MPFFVIVLYLAAMGVVYTFRLLPEARVEATNDLLITLVCLIASYNLFRVARQFQKGETSRQCWNLFATGLFLEGIGHAIYSTAEWVFDVYLTFPRFPDFLIMAGELFYVWSFFLFLSQFDRLTIVSATRRRLVANSFFGVLLIAQLVFFVYPTLTNPQDPLWLKLMHQIYPAIDLLLAFFCIHLSLGFFTLGYSPVVKAWCVLVFAYIIFLITDISFTYAIFWQVYHPYLWINIGWGLAYLLLSYASYIQWHLMLSLKRFSLPHSFDDLSPDL